MRSYILGILRESDFRIPTGRWWALPFPLLILLLLMLPAAPLAAQDQADASGPMHWRITWLSDPATGATLAWNTRIEGQSHLVRIRKRDIGATFREIPATRNGAYSYAKAEESPLYYHYVQLEDLQPDTAYDVQFVSDGNPSPRFYFKTAPIDRSFSLLFGGDSRSDHEKRREMNRMMAGLVEAGAATGDPADEIVALMHGGDYVQSGMKRSHWTKWMSDHELTVGNDGRLLPIIPARGNHDRGRLFCEVFGFQPKDTHNWYAISVGNLLRIVTLNTETSIAGKQAKWLSEELERSRPRHTWLICQYHRPAYAAVKWPSGALIHWVPRFEKYDVDLVCEADGHNIKRTMPIRKGKPATFGVTYIGEGGLGVSQRTPKSKRWYLREPGMSDRGHHVQRLKLEPDRLTYECIRLGGEICDRWERIPIRMAKQQRKENQ